jgi:hypothetical protein
MLIVNVSLVFAIMKIYNWYTLQIMPIVIRYQDYSEVQSMNLLDLNLRISNELPFYQIEPQLNYDSS